jgi:D-alanyl-D-alanine endopeptidase (penicillin-binding protein 7)
MGTMKLTIKFIITATLLICSTANAAPSVWVYNQTLDTIVLNQNSNVTRPIASITKLMTAIVALDHDAGLARKLKLSNRAGSYLPPGQYTRRQLFDAMLVRSDNAAAETLAEDYPGGRVAFLRAMHRRAAGLGMSSTRFQDPSGLSRNNTGTAGDMGTLVIAAGAYPLIREISVQQQVRIESHFKQRIRIIALPNTNQPVLFSFDNIQVSKTGFTNPAGWCVALLVEKNKQTFAVVVLGAENKARRLDTVRDLMYNHINDAVELPTVDNYEFIKESIWP